MRNQSSSKSTTKLSAELSAEQQTPVDPILTMAEAARQIGKHPSTVARWAQDGLLEVVTHPTGLDGIRQSHLDEIYKPKRLTKQ